MCQKMEKFTGYEYFSKTHKHAHTHQQLWEAKALCGQFKASLKQKIQQYTVQP